MEQYTSTPLQVQSIEPIPNVAYGQHIKLQALDGDESTLDLRVSGPYAKQFENFEVGQVFDLCWPQPKSQSTR